VDGADRDAPPAAPFDFTADGGAVGVGAKPQERQHHHLFEFAEDRRRQLSGHAA
jgi:hypothetical protein